MARVTPEGLTTAFLTYTFVFVSDTLNLPELPAGFRWKLGTSIYGAQVNLQKKGVLWWYTVDSCIPLSLEGTPEQDIERGGRILWERHTNWQERKRVMYKHAGEVIA